MTRSKPGFFEKLFRFSFLLAGLTGAMRLYGAVTQQPDILLFSDKNWLSAYLMAAGGVLGLVNLTLWLLLKSKPSLPAWLPWSGVLVSILAYWLERLFLWAPTQRGTNAGWMVGVHVCWLLLALISDLQRKRRSHEYK